MSVRPVARGLIACEQVVIDAGTRNATLVNCFNARHFKVFPSPPFNFCLYSPLSGGLGYVKTGLAITGLRSSSVIYARDITFNFVDKIQQVRYLFRLTDLSFPEPGAYSVVLTADGEWLAETVINISR
jgi:hypothetical protein